MVARHYYRNDAGTLTEVTAVQREGWAYREASEEGEASSVTVSVPDPTMSLNFVPWRRWVVYEDTSEDSNEVIFSGFVSSFEIGRIGGEDQEPVGRVWTLSLVDMNTLWDNRILVGADTKRPAESDVERMEWLVATEEMGYFDDISLLAAGSPVDMDKRDTRGTTPKGVADDCAQQASKNYWIGATGTTGVEPDNFVWYGKDANNSYLSPLSLSNDPADWTDAALFDGTSTVWPISYDAKLTGSGERIYSGAYVEYEKGAVYRRNAATMSYFTLSGRDISHPAPEIKTKTKAIARANALVNRLNEVLYRVTLTVELPAAKASMIRTGMLIDIKGTHWPTFGLGRTCRIVNATPSPVAAGRKYRIAIEAVPIGDAALSCSLSLAARDVAHADTGGYASPTATVNITVSSDSPTIIIGAAIAKNSNTPTCTGMTPSGSYTQIFSQNLTSGGTAHPATALMYRAVSAAGSYAVSASYTSGFSPSDSEHWGVAALAFQCSSSSPVQTKTHEFAVADSVGEATFDSTPGAGNLGVVSVTLKDMSSDADVDAVVLDQAGWTKTVTARAQVGIGIDCTILFAKCLDAEDGSRFSVSGLSKGGIISLSEWAL